MTARIVRKGVDDLEPELAIELWRLEAVGCNHHLKTPPSARLRLRQFEQTSTNPLTALPLMHPDLTNLTAPAPRMPAESSDELALGIATEHSQSQRVDDPGRLGVELVKPMLENVDLCQRRIRTHDQFLSRHRFVHCPNTK